MLGEEEGAQVVRRLRLFGRLRRPRPADHPADRRRDRHGQVDGRDRGRLPARDHARHLDRLHPADDARVLLAGVHARDPLLELRGGRRRRTRTTRIESCTASSTRPATCSSASEPRSSGSCRRAGRWCSRACTSCPGMVSAEIEGALVVQFVLAIDDVEAHASHFWLRDSASGSARPFEQYLDALGDIREHPGLHRRAGREGGRARDREQQHRAGDRAGDGARARERRAVREGRMTETAPIRQREGSALDRYCLCESYARATERAALAGARWLGRGPTRRAPSATPRRRCGPRSSTCRSTVRIVIGAGADEDETLARGQRVGAGGEQVDLALDPLEGRGVVARGGGGAMSMIAVGEPGSLQTLARHVHAQAGGRPARPRRDRSAPPGRARTSAAIAEAFGRSVNDVTTIVLDRPRHHDLIEEIRAAGARIKLIQDGDVTASISAAIRGTNDHLAIGIGGTRQAVMAAAALRCLGGELQAQLWPTTRSGDRGGARVRDRGHGADLHDRRSLAGRGDRRRDRRLERRPAPRRPLPRRLARARTRSSCAPAATGFASSTASTSSPASAAKKCGLS